MENATAEQPAPAANRKPKLTRLKIESFRNVAPCELRFGDGLNVLLGLNATGKTTLLELVAAALSFDFSRFKEEAFALEWELAFSTGTIVVAMRNERLERPESDGPAFHHAERLSPTAKLNIHLVSPSQAWTVRADMASLWVEEKPGPKYPLSSPLGERKSSLLALAAEATMSNSLALVYIDELWLWEDACRFDEALDMFRDITSSATCVEIRISPPGGPAYGFNIAGFIPTTLLRAVGQHAEEMRGGIQGITIPQESLDFLREIGALFGFKSARLEMRLTGKGRTTLRLGDFRFMFEDYDGSVIRHDELSYGQKRLLAFYYYLAASPLTIIADELVDGLHHLWIDAAVTAIGDRQAFLASQNPLLLDHLEFDSAEQVASTFITCRTERSGDDKRMTWANLSEYDAERFFRAYQVDVKHVSEILLSKGLW